MSSPLDHSRYSINHARRRLNELEATLIAFYKRGPYSECVDPNDDGTEDVYGIEQREPIPETIPGNVFDVVNALRAALDQAGFAVAKARGTSGRHAAFPFGESRDYLYQEKVRHRFSNLPDEIYDLMVAFQPYKGGNDTLWALNVLCSQAKHRTFHLGLAPGAAWAGYHFKNVKRVWVPPKWERSKNKAKLFAMDAGVKPDHKFTLEFSVCLYGPFPERPQPVLGFLNLIASEVEGVVVAIEAEARRLGIFPPPKP